MPGMKPARRRSDEITKEIDKLINSQQSRLEDWMRQRFAPDSALPQPSAGGDGHDHADVHRQLEG
jgi:hypothetical protein